MVVVCVETGRELRSILHLPDTVPVPGVLSCDRIVQYAWDRRVPPPGRRGRVRYGAAEPHGPWRT